VPGLCEIYPGICLTTEEKVWKNLSQGNKTSVRVRKTLNQVKENLSQGYFCSGMKYEPCLVFASFTLEFALQLRKKYGKISVRVKKPQSG